MTIDPSQMNLAQLILAKKGDRTYSKISEDCGGLPTQRRLNSLVLKPMIAFPDVETLRGLSIGLGVSMTDVLLASGRSLGLTVGLGDPGTISIPGAGQLPETSKRVLVDMARELLKMQQQTGAKKEFTLYQSELRQDFAHGARLRRVPAPEIDAVLQAGTWYMVKPEDDDLQVVDAVLGWVTYDHARQLKAALRDALAGGVEVVQDDVELAADKGNDGIHPEELEHTS